MTERFDWPALMAAGIRGLGLRPDQFWSLTPAELSFLLGRKGSAKGMDRMTLDALALRYPDSPEGSDVS